MATQELISIPQVCGSQWWAMGHAWAESIRDAGCSGCGDFAVAAMNALHDVVNHKLGKPIQTPEDLKSVAGIFNRAASSLAEAAQDCESPLHAQLANLGPLSLELVKMGNEVDPFGSRCRDLLGRWIKTDDCEGIIDTQETIAETSRTFAIGANGLTRYEMDHQIRGLDSLIASHDAFTFELNPAYPAELQPRLRDRAATRLQVEKIAANIDPDSLLTDFRTLDRGSPIIGPDNVVESGNGRTMALIRASVEFPNSWQGYQQALKEIAPSLGISFDTIRRIKNPVLVRVRTEEVNRVDFTREGNAGSGIAFSAIETARTDAKAITIAMLNVLSMGQTQTIEDALRSRTNRQFVQSFMTKLPETEQAGMVDGEGVLNQDGVRRVVLAIFVAAFPGDSGLKLAAKAFESTDGDVKTVFNAISRSLGPLSRSEALTRSGDRNPDLGIADNLVSAITVFSKVKATPGLSVRDYLAQLQLFERELTPFEEQILLVLDERTRSARRLAAVFMKYADLVIESPPPAQQSFLTEAGPDKPTLWAQAVRIAEPEPEPQTTLFQTVPRWFADPPIRWTVEIEKKLPCVVVPSGIGTEKLGIILTFDRLIQGQTQAIQTFVLKDLKQRGKGAPCYFSPNFRVGDLLEETFKARGNASAFYRVTRISRRSVWVNDLTRSDVVDILDGKVTRFPEDIRPAFEPEPDGDDPLQPRLFQAAQTTGERSSFSALSLAPMSQGFLSEVVGSLAAGLGFGLGGFAADRAIRTIRSGGFISMSGEKLSKDTIKLDVSGLGEFVREQVRESKFFHPDSFRTITTGEVKRVVGCPLFSWDSNTKECKGSMETQSILRERTLAPALIEDAKSRGLPVVGLAATAKPLEEEVNELITAMIAEGVLTS